MRPRTSKHYQFHGSGARSSSRENYSKLMQICYKQSLERNGNYNISPYQSSRVNSHHATDGFLLNFSISNRKSDLFKRAFQQTALHFYRRSSFLMNPKSCIDQQEDYNDNKRKDYNNDKSLDVIIRKLSKRHRKIHKKAINETKVVTIRANALAFRKFATRRTRSKHCTAKKVAEYSKNNENLTMAISKRMTGDEKAAEGKGVVTLDKEKISRLGNRESLSLLKSEADEYFNNNLLNQVYK
eukprot:TRINITY_DN9360_c0_g2_i1.p1 TRINITY_DN9360_c0_g2~~TRINITY_DN9360_c0_g2_i1.p1  ORF type:complete len:241 (-),score=19.80 TRINITY_DN9360_c0_g2_i1:26-748(-)